MEHPSLTKQFNVNLTEIASLKRQVREIREYLETVKNTSPLVTLQTDKLIRLLELAEQQSSRVEKKEFQSFRRILEQNLSQFNDLIGKLEGLTVFLEKLTANAELEREVLEKINQRL